MKNKFVCIHGHFYQPPRENPWTGLVEREASAAPYHDWNERIFKECYEANVASPILDEQGRTRKALNNYEYISFNFGPTLLSWLEREHPETHRRIVDADRASIRSHHGHGNAMAQVYNHIIMPLAPRRDKETQVRWGVADFESRFRRKPEGMWLAETAVDEESLEILISESIRFTVLAPKQAARIRAIGSNGEWRIVSESTLDTTRPYRWFSKERPGRFIDVFFYFGPLAQAVSFERLLNSGEFFARRLINILAPNDSPQLAHIATDGENYGHHHRFGNMALSYAIEVLSHDPAVRITNYGEFLSIAPSSYEVEIHSKTAWSCAHGVGRWQDDCGCSTGAHPNWNQKWRRPLRDSLDWLAGEIDEFYVRRFRESGSEDPWKARDGYIASLSTYGRQSLRALLRRLLVLDPARTKDERLLLEMERQRLYMFTSCGWFFDDISGIEPVQILKYAARAMDLAVSSGHPKGADLEAQLLDRLARCPSNEPQYTNGADVYQKLVVPSRATADRAKVPL